MRVVTPYNPYASSGGGGASIWGGITGTLSDQTDLQTYLSSLDTADLARLVASNNLSDLVNATVARSNLGLGSAAVQNVGAFLQPANNLSDVTTPATARTNLGGTTLGQNLFTKANPGAITYIRINADNTVDLLSAADFRSAIGAVGQDSGIYGIDCAGDTVAASSTRYYSPYGGSTTDSTEASREKIIPKACVLSDFYVAVSGTQSATGALTFTIRKNQTGTTVTITIAAGQTTVTSSDTTHTVTFAAGDKFAIEAANAATSASIAILGFAYVLTRT